MIKDNLFWKIQNSVILWMAKKPLQNLKKSCNMSQLNYRPVFKKLNFFDKLKWRKGWLLLLFRSWFQQMILPNMLNYYKKNSNINCTIVFCKFRRSHRFSIHFWTFYFLRCRHFWKRSTFQLKKCLN